MSRRKKPNSIGGQFAPRLIEMLESPAYRALSLSAHRVLARIEIELAQHGGKDNGGLPVTYNDFQDYGIDRHHIAPAIREGVALKFIAITKPGRGGNAEHRAPNEFRLTYRHTKGAEPSHDWRRIATAEQAAKLARQARAPMHGKKFRTPVGGFPTGSGGKKIRTPVGGLPTASGGNPHRNHTCEPPTTGPVGEPPTTLDISGWGLPGGTLSAEAAGTIRTTPAGQGKDAVEVVHNDERCFGYLRHTGSSYQAWWSGERFDDHFIGEFASEEDAIQAVVENARSARAD
jgi:hypothetical protein